MSTFRQIDPATAHRLVGAGEALLLDIREPDEQARERIEGAASLPLSGLDHDATPVETGGRLAILYCRSGARTAANAPRLAAAIRGDCALLEGGLAGWKATGLPARLDRRQPIEIMRQVQIAAGSLVLLGVLLAALASPWFLLLAGFVGAGLVLAGLTGWCGMAHLLAHAPWNRAHTTPDHLATGAA